ncbi:MAG: FAD-dependent oxidoreductase [Candidatus Acidiferrales bacterium]
MSAQIAVAGAGIYGAVAAIRLAERGHRVHLFDPRGIISSATAINQYRVHSGYHYPRSPETICEILEARAEFIEAFRPAIVFGSRQFYAIPKSGSRVSPDRYERIMGVHGLPLRPCHPSWIDFDFIDRCYQVDESVYDPGMLRQVVTERIDALRIPFQQTAFTSEMRRDYDFVVWATYGMAPSKAIFEFAKFQVAEKILIELPPELRQTGLVIIDGPFTAFDPYGVSQQSLFGSAKNTNHWTSTDPDEQVPERYRPLMNSPEWTKVAFTNFEAMRRDATLAVPASCEALYLGSRFTIRVVEDSSQDRRILHVREGAPGEFHIFSGKVVSAVKAARILCEKIEQQ